MAPSHQPPAQGLEGGPKRRIICGDGQGPLYAASGGCSALPYDVRRNQSKAQVKDSLEPQAKE